MASSVFRHCQYMQPRLDSETNLEHVCKEVQFKIHAIWGAWGFLTYFFFLSHMPLAHEAAKKMYIKVSGAEKYIVTFTLMLCLNTSTKALCLDSVSDMRWHTVSTLTHTGKHPRLKYVALLCNWGFIISEGRKGHNTFFSRHAVCVAIEKGNL